MQWLSTPDFMRFLSDALAAIRGTAPRSSGGRSDSPCASAQPSAVTRRPTVSFSTPSAKMVKPNSRPSAMMVRAMREPLSSRSSDCTKLRSILRRSAGRRSRYGQRRVPGAKVIDGYGRTHFAQAGEDVNHRLQPPYGDGLGDLDLQRRCFALRLPQSLLHHCQKTCLPQLHGRDIHRHVHIWKTRRTESAARPATRSAATSCPCPQSGPTALPPG